MSDLISTKEIAYISTKRINQSLALIVQEAREKNLAKKKFLRAIEEYEFPYDVLDDRENGVYQIEVDAPGFCRAHEMSLVGGKNSKGCYTIEIAIFIHRWPHNEARDDNASRLCKRSRDYFVKVERYDGAIPLGGNGSKPLRRQIRLPSKIQNPLAPVEGDPSKGRVWIEDGTLIMEWRYKP